MKRNVIIYILVLSTILSCKRQDNSLPNEIIKIKNITTVPTDASLYTTTESFIYDSLGRLTSIIRSTADTLRNTYYQYNGSLIVKQVPADLPRIDTLYLNQDGLVTKLIMGGHSEFKYKYDSEGFLLVEGNTISNGNVIERYYEYTSNQGNGYTEHFIYNYYDYDNTIYYGENILEYQNGNDNIGIYFWGKQNKNLLKNIEIPNSGMFKEFTYKFDTHNRVREMEITEWGEKIFIKKYEYY